MDTVSQTVEVSPKREGRRHPIAWKRWLVEQTFEPGTSIARVARENNVNANQVWAWRKLYTQGLLTDGEATEVMLSVVVDNEPTSMPAPQTPSSPTTPEAVGSIQIEHGKTSIRIHGVPDPTILRYVLDRVLR
jgi:transposase